MAAACPFCPIVAALQDAETYARAGSENIARRVALLPASVVVLAVDQYYRGYTLVISRTHATELHELPEAESRQYLEDMRRTAAAVAAAFSPRKLNYELLGNTVAHLHWHLFPRYAWDENPTRPVWEHTHAPRPVTAQEAGELIAALRRHL